MHINSKKYIIPLAVHLIGISKNYETNLENLKA